MALKHALLLIAVFLTGNLNGAEPTLPVSVSVDATTSLGPLKPIWRFFGADEPNYATAPDGQKLLQDLGELRPNQVYFRTHNLLTSGDGKPALKWGSTNAYTEDSHGKPVYDWTILDGIFDAYRAHAVRPYVEIGFMPEAMSVHPEPYRHHWTPTADYKEIYTGWSYPPKDYAKWGELAYQWARHSVERYGRAEVATWYWEVWNESNNGYWRGTPEEFRKLHDFAVAGVRRALPEAKVGGADTAGAGGQFTRDFIEHCLRGVNFATGERGTPLDFVSFHAKGAPTFVEGHVRMGLANQLRAIDSGFAIVASYPELKTTPIVIGESDPDGCAACQGDRLGYRNGTLYSSYTAACIAREFELADRHHVNLEGVLTWAFEFEGEPWFAGFRVLANHGVDLPVFNVFRMLSRMGGNRIAAVSSGERPLDSVMKSGVREAPDVGVLASVQAGRLSVLLWNYHDDDLPGPTADVTLQIKGLPAQGVSPRLFQIDSTHSNAFTAWKEMGSPQAPTQVQVRNLESASRLASGIEPAIERGSEGGSTIHLEIPRQGVFLVEFDWQNPPLP